jgi:hypothetical protein
MFFCEGTTGAAWLSPAVCDGGSEFGVAGGGTGGGLPIGLSMDAISVLTSPFVDAPVAAVHSGPVFREGLPLISLLLIVEADVVDDTDDAEGIEPDDSDL